MTLLGCAPLYVIARSEGLSGFRRINPERRGNLVPLFAYGFAWGLKIRALIRPNTIAAVMPAAVRVMPPTNAPQKP